MNKGFIDTFKTRYNAVSNDYWEMRKKVTIMHLVALSAVIASLLFFLLSLIFEVGALIIFGWIFLAIWMALMFIAEAIEKESLSNWRKVMILMKWDLNVEGDDDD